MKIPASKFRKVLSEFFSSKAVIDVAGQATETAAKNKKLFADMFDGAYKRYNKSSAYKLANEVVGETMSASSKKAEIYGAVDTAFSEGDVRKITNLSNQLGYDAETLKFRLSKGQNRKVKDELSSLAQQKAKKQVVEVFEEDLLAMSAGENKYIKRAKGNAFTKSFNEEEYIDELVNARSAYTDEPLKRNTKDLEKSLKDLAGDNADKLISQAKAKSTAEMFNTDRYIGELIKVKKSLQDIIEEQGGYRRPGKGLFAIADDYLSDTPGKIDRAYRTFSQSGELGVAKNMSHLFKLHKATSKLNGYGQSIGSRITRVLNELDDEGLKVRQYVEQKNPKRFQYDAQNRLVYDRDLAEEIGMSVDEVRLANKVNNFYRSAAKTHVDIETRGDLSLSNMYKTWDEIPDDKIVNLDPVGKGDYGHNYWHAKPNEEYFEKHLKSDQAYIEATKKDDYNINTRIFYGRKGESGLRSDYANRVTPAEEIETYSNEFFRQQPYRIGKHLLNQTKMTLAIPKKEVVGKYSDKLKDLKRIEQDWDNMFRKGRDFEEMTKPEQLYGEFVKGSISLALSNPLLWMFNAHQSLMTSSATKGFGRVLKETIKTDTKFAKEVLKYGSGLTRGKTRSQIMEGLWKDTVPGVANRKELLKAQMAKQFRDRNPQIFALPTEELMKHTSVATKRNGITGKAKELFDRAVQYSLVPFKTSDLLARHVTMKASVGKADDVLESVYKKVKAGKIDNLQARSEIERKLHFREFSSVDSEGMTKIPLNNIKKTKSYKDWYTQPEVQDMIYDYGELSVKAELFNYDKFGRQTVMNALSAKSPLLAQTFTFKSWPLYYTKLLKSQVDEAVTGYKNKDFRLMEPLFKSSVVGLSAYALGSYAATSDSDFVNHFGRYMQGRVPAMSPFSFASSVTTQPLGMLDPAVGVGLYVSSTGMKQIDKAVEGMTGEEIEGMSTIDFIQRVGLKKTLKTPAVFRGKQFIESLESLQEEK